MSEKIKIETTISRDYKPVYDDLTEEWIVPLNDKTTATIYGLSATECTAYKLYEAWHKYNEAEPDYELILQNKDLEIAKLHDEKEYYKSDSEDWRSMCEEMDKSINLILPLAKGYKPENQSINARRTCDSWIEHAEETLTKYNAMKGENNDD